MADELLDLQSIPDARYLIAGWRRQWSDGRRDLQWSAPLPD